MERYLFDLVYNDLGKKMVFMTGPRQVGKTYLAKQIQKKFPNSVYLNYDDIDDAMIIKKRIWPQNSPLVIFDEIHKMKGWKNYLKGTYDTRPEGQTFLVTGSARLDIFRLAGDSLAGRYFHYRLNPLSVKELANDFIPFDAVALLGKLGPFPEPFLSGSLDESNKWRRQYFSDIVREDILELGKIQEIRTIRLLIEMLRKRVGSPLSFKAIAEDLQVAPNTVRKYITILESLYIVSLIYPYHKNIARAVLKEPKLYFYDTGYVDGDEGKRLENTTALCLLKHVQYLQDTRGIGISLNYVRTKDGKEIDFALVRDDQLTHCIEVKLSDSEPSGNLRYFQNKISDVSMVQLVHNLRQEKDVNNILIRSAGKWLSELDA